MGMYCLETEMDLESHLFWYLQKNSLFKNYWLEKLIFFWIFSWFPLLGCILLEGCINDQVGS